MQTEPENKSVPAETERAEGGGRVLILKRNHKIVTLLYQGNRLLRADACDPQRAVLHHIYIGKVKNVVQNIQAAFVEFKPGRLAFLPLRDCKEPLLTNRAYDGRLIAGDELVLQIVSEGRGAKEVSASTNLSFSGRYLALAMGRTKAACSKKLTDSQRERLTAFAQEDPLFREACAKYGLLFRTNAGEAKELSALKEELRELLEAAERVGEHARHRTCYSLLWEPPAPWLKDLQDFYLGGAEKILTDDAALYEQTREYLEKFRPSGLPRLVLYEDPQLSLSALFGVEARLSEALSRKVWLRSGGYLVIEQTEALVSIDVNSGKYSAGKESGQTYFTINMEAAREIARQLVLRNLSGIIVIDFINMKDAEQKKELMECLQRETASDPIRTSVVDMTRLGLVELTRRKEKKPLWEQLER